MQSIYMEDKPTDSLLRHAKCKGEIEIIIGKNQTIKCKECRRLIFFKNIVYIVE